MHLPIHQAALVAALQFAGVVAALNTTCRPGGNFDLRMWELETSIDNGKGQPLVISAKSLGGNQDGCTSGWQDKGKDHQWFFTVRSAQPIDPSLSPLVLSALAHHACPCRLSGNP
jgi:hypothetical protein